MLASLPSQAPGSTQGAAYSVQDVGLPGQTAWYWLEDIDLSGATTLHGPVSATFGAPTAVTLNEVLAASQGPSGLSWLALAAALASLGLAALALRRRMTLR